MNRKVIKKHDRIYRIILNRIKIASPCKTCIVQACCSVPCEEFDSYHKFIKFIITDELEKQNMLNIDKFSSLYRQLLFDMAKDNSKILEYIQSLDKK